MAAIGDIVEYEVTDADVSTNGTLVTGDVFPLLVVSVNAEDGTYSGTVFTLNGTFNVHVPPVAPVQADTDVTIDFSNPDTFATDIANMTDAEKAQLLAALSPAPASPPAPVTTPGPTVATTGGNVTNGGN